MSRTHTGAKAPGRQDEKGKASLSVYHHRSTGTRYKEKFQALREKYDRVNAINDEYQRELGLANEKLKKIQAENDVLLDYMMYICPHNANANGSATNHHPSHPYSQPQQPPPPPHAYPQPYQTHPHHPRQHPPNPFPTPPQPNPSRSSGTTNATTSTARPHHLTYTNGNNNNNNGENDTAPANVPRLSSRLIEPYDIPTPEYPPPSSASHETNGRHS